MKAVHGSKKPRKTIAVLEAENAELRARVASLEALVQTLASKPMQLVPVAITPNTFRVPPGPIWTPYIAPTAPLVPLTPTWPSITVTCSGTTAAGNTLGTYEVLS